MSSDGTPELVDNIRKQLGLGEDKISLTVKNL